MSRVYELICRHFLAICSHDATVSNTQVTLKISDESFKISGQTIETPGYLEVFSTYEKVADNVLPDHLCEVGLVIPMIDLGVQLRVS